ncbi:MAG TPA: tripartite tricarboxylate transporter permease [Paenalcaligenes hominis]|uniref:Tricarboxylic transport membrane protein n=1 Tax=Paenalcaligenes hominis TaxID=643674 RepID=A0A9D2VHB8_9BURK|nr:tripartite tricarboxylate transporter permease [Paenalcaligenes hominis]NJB64622.1 putative tricarboxylic transport membrane protein [Paenalcaligenes hominis]GGE60293.1 membrane protein [Paenalcaligenes hominis]HJH24444.1 tripartite tricarboxylate transporter permease [Paenalcaligenes hominis]
MIDTFAFSQAINLLFSDLSPWLYVIPGLMIGLIFGAVPGLQISMAMAVFLPITWMMDFLQAMLFLTAIFTGGAYGGGVTAILMNIPGSSSSVATAFDGYPMAQKGKHNEALGLGLGASVVGTFIGYLLLLLLIQPLAGMVLRLGPLEMVMIVLWGLALIATLNDSTVAKGLLAGVLGLLLSQVGMSSTGVMRTTIGNPYLIDGIAVVPAMIGLFAASELLRIRSNAFLVQEEASRKISFKKILSGFFEVFKHPKILLKGSFIGALIGAVPGVGSSVANLVAYGEIRRNAKNQDEFGKGAPEGLIAAESSNSSSEGGSMTALLALGIPGGAATAVLLAAFSFHNLVGGPAFIRDQRDLVYSIIIGNFGQVILLAFVALMILPILGLVVRIPLTYLVPSVLALCAWGGFGITGTVAGPMTVMVFAGLGWLMRRHAYPVAATVIGLLLGKMAEGEMVRTLQISAGNPLTYFAERPIAIVLLVLFILSAIVMPILRKQKEKKTQAPV